MLLKINHPFFTYEHLLDSPENLEEAFVHNHVKPRYDKGCIFMYQII